MPPTRVAVASADNVGPAIEAEGVSASDAPQTSAKGAQTLVQTALDSSAQKGRGGSRKRTVDQVVAKAIYDNFRSWTALQTDGVLVSGLTLRQRLAKDRQTALDAGDKKAAFGRKYDDMLKLSYAPEGDPAGQLIVRDGSEEVCNRLSKALTRLRSATSDKAGWFAIAVARFALGAQCCSFAHV